MICVIRCLELMCDELYWYKGPSSDGQFEPIYDRRTSADENGLNEVQVEEAYGDWIGRVSLIGKLVLSISYTIKT